MKYSAVLASLALAASASQKAPRRPQGGLAGLAGGLGKELAVHGIDQLEPEIRKGVPGVKRTLTKFGPLSLAASTVPKEQQAPGGHGGAGHSDGGHGGAEAGGSMEGMSHGGGGMGMGGMGDNTLGGQTFMLRIKKGFCNEGTGCTVYGGRIGIAFADGTPAGPASGVYIHHVLTSDITKGPSAFLTSCGGTRPGMSINGMGIGSGFLGGGEDSGDLKVIYTRLDGTSDSGFWIGPDDSFLVNVALVNYNNEKKDVVLTYDTEWKAGLQGTDAKGMLIAVDSCRGARLKTSLDGPTTTNGGDFTVMEDGAIIDGRGHLHDGGVQIDMQINKKHVCTSVAGYGGEGSENGGVKTISSMSHCEKPIEVKKGDKLSMSVTYDLQKYPPRKSASGKVATDAMGMWSLTFEPKFSAKKTAGSTSTGSSLAGLTGSSKTASKSNGSGLAGLLSGKGSSASRSKTSRYSYLRKLIN